MRSALLVIDVQQSFTHRPYFSAADLPAFLAAAHEAGLVHPNTLWPCESWQAAWIDLDGKTVRPIPGREEDYEEEASELASENGDFVFDPPPKPRPPKAERRAAKKPWWRFW